MDATTTSSLGSRKARSRRARGMGVSASAMGAGASAAALLLLLLLSATAAAAAAFVGPTSPHSRAHRLQMSAAAAPSGGAGGGYGRRLLTPAERLRAYEPSLREIAQRMEEAGLGKTHIVQDKSLGPGLQSQHYRFETTEAGAVFVKVSPKLGAIRMFEAQAESLRVIGATETLRVPRPYAQGLLANGHAFLALEYMDPVPFGPSIKSVAAELGEGLALLHSAPLPFIGNHYGMQTNTFLGATEQANEWGEDFARFFLERRLLPQLMAATDKLASAGSTTRFLSEEVTPRSLDRLLFHCEKLLAPVRQVRPSLLHGNLWQAKCGATRAGRQAFALDPACWYGHAEYDLALASLFGGFLPQFYQAYHAIVPAEEDMEARQEVYRLFHLLHQLNNFGAGFGPGGTASNPKGYLERCLQLMRSISSR